VEVAVIGCKDVVPEEIKVLAQSKVARLGKLAPVLEQAEVRLTDARDRPGTRYSCEVTLVGHGHRLRARASAHDLAAAVDIVVDKLEHQVERLKGKVLSRSHPRRRPMREVA